MKKNFYVHGSFMNDNFGDFLLYEVVMSKLERYEDKFNIFSSDVSESYDLLYPVKRKSKLYSIFRSDLAVLAGGGYFGEPDKRKLYWSIRFICKHAIPLSILRFRKIPYAIIGVGVGPLSYAIPRNIVKFIFRGAKEISVRDIESKEYLNKIGIKKEIKITPDWVMGMSIEELVRNKYEAEKIISGYKFNTSNKTIFVHLTTKNNYDGKGMSLVIEELIRFAHSDKNINFIIGCDQDRNTQKERAQDILEKMPSERTRMLKYMGPWTLCSIINKADIVITDKLHVGIVGTRLHKNVISFASHSKALRFYNQIGRSENSVKLSNITKEEINELLKKSKEQKPVDIDEIVKQAQNNGKILYEFIKSIT